MSDTCPKCGRPTNKDGFEWMGWCISIDTHSCQIIADAYRRGMREAIEVAKELATVEIVYRSYEPRPYHAIRWSDVYEEIARRIGDD